MTPSPGTPEQKARAQVDAALVAAGWTVQDRDAMNLSAGRGVAVREFKLAPGHGFADYLLFVDGKAVGVIEAKPEGHTLSGVEVQVEKYSTGLPAGLHPPVEPLPFLYLSTGSITKFTNLLDPDARSRRIFHLHQPDTLAEWLAADTLDAWVKSAGHFTAADDTKPSSLRARLRAMPSVQRASLYPNQLRAVINLEHSLFQNRPRALVQTATGSGKTIMAVTAAYRLIKFGGARRVLFLVDRSNLGEQAEKEFQAFRTPDDNRLLPPGNLHVSGKVEWSARNTRHMPETWAAEFPSFVVGPGELVMNLTAQSLADEFLGRICMTGLGERCLLNQRIARLTPIFADVRFMLWSFKASAFRRYVDSLNTGSLIQHMFTSQLARFVLALPPKAEQVRIVAEVERHLTVADEIDADIKHGLGRSSQLLQSILRWAFQGKLADQDPRDEPATVLLERIRAERAAQSDRAPTAITTDRRGRKGRLRRTRREVR